MPRPTRSWNASRIAGSLDRALDGVDYVQENTSEDVDVKRLVFAKLDAAAGPDTVLAISTSYIVPSAFTEDLAGRQRCLVAHPINPPHLVPAVELVPAPWTLAAVMDRARNILSAAGQSCIMMRREVNGFVMNRLQAVLLQESVRMVAEGYASTEGRGTAACATGSACAGRSWGRSRPWS